MKNLYAILLIMLFLGMTSATYANEEAVTPAAQEGATTEGDAAKKGEEEPDCD